MRPHREVVTCSACHTQVTVVADRGNGDRSMTVFSVTCPACRARIGMRAPYDLDERTIQIVGFQRPSSSEK